MSVVLGGRHIPDILAVLWATQLGFGHVLSSHLKTDSRTCEDRAAISRHGRFPVLVGRCDLPLRSTKLVEMLKVTIWDFGLVGAAEDPDFKVLY